MDVFPVGISGVEGTGNAVDTGFLRRSGRDCRNPVATEGKPDSPSCVLDTGESSLRSPCRYDGCVTVLGGRPVNTVELSTLTYQIVGRQPFAAETNRVPSRHRDADLPLNLTVFGRPVPLR